MMSSTKSRMKWSSFVDSSELFILSHTLSSGLYEYPKECGAKTAVLSGPSEQLQTACQRAAGLDSSRWVSMKSLYPDPVKGLFHV